MFYSAEDDFVISRAKRDYMAGRCVKVVSDSSTVERSVWDKKRSVEMVIESICER